VFVSVSNRRTALWIALAAAVVLVAGLAPGCAKKEQAVSTTSDSTGGQGQPADTTSAAQPESLAAGHIEVQHVLVGFKGTVPGKPITRTQAEAKALAHDILARAKKGESFDQLVQQYTDDQFPGVYRLADRGLEAVAGVEYPRDGMVKGFSDCAFSLKIGEVGIAEYSPTTSKYGWHIIKRLR
jgi:hypothetical protein